MAQCSERSVPILSFFPPVCIFSYESVALTHDTVYLLGQKFSMLTGFSFRAALSGCSGFHCVSRKF